jgi:hypothetical protein
MPYVRTHVYDVETRDEAVELFERDAAQYLVNAVREDADAVMLYYRDGVEIAYFDYENYWGGVRELLTAEEYDPFDD